MEKNKILRGLIILVAVVVILESVIIIGRLGKGEEIAVFKTETPTVVEKQAEAAVMLVSSTEKWSKGRMGKVDVDVTVTRDMAVDAIDLFVKYDPEKVTVNRVSFEGGIKPTLNKISQEKGLVIANYLITEKSGMPLTIAEATRLLTIEATPKVSGDIQFEVATGKSTDGSVTMIIENEKSTEVEFNSLPLTVNVL